MLPNPWSGSASVELPVSCQMQAIKCSDTDPSPSWVLDYLMRQLHPWESIYRGKEKLPEGWGQRRSSDGDGGDHADGGSGGDRGADRHFSSKSGGKCQQGSAGSVAGSLASERYWMRSSNISPSRRVMALPYELTATGQGGCNGRLAGIPAPRYLDYDTELSGGFAVGLSHYNSHVFATRCDDGLLLWTGLETGLGRLVQQVDSDQNIACMSCLRPSRMAFAMLLSQHQPIHRRCIGKIAPCRNKGGR
jgi:hypothetical protein